MRVAGEFLIVCFNSPGLARHFYALRTVSVTAAVFPPRHFYRRCHRYHHRLDLSLGAGAGVPDHHGDPPVRRSFLDFRFCAGGRGSIADPEFSRNASRPRAAVTLLILGTNRRALEFARRWRPHQSWDIGFWDLLTGTGIAIDLKYPVLQFDELSDYLRRNVACRCRQLSSVAVVLRALL